jgi:hypothetical protein
MHARKLLALGLTASCALAAIAADAPAAKAEPATAFRDVLDSPAIKSPQALRGLFNGLAQAGTRIIAVGQRGHDAPLLVQPNEALDRCPANGPGRPPALTVEHDDGHRVLFVARAGGKHEAQQKYQP